MKNRKTRTTDQNGIGRRLAALVLSLALVFSFAVLPAAGAEGVTKTGNVLIAADKIQISLREGNLLVYSLPHNGDSETVRAEFTLTEILLGGRERDVSTWGVSGVLSGEIGLGSFGAWRLKALVTDGALEEWAYSDELYLSNEMEARQNEVQLEPDMGLAESAFEGSQVTAIRLYEGLECIPERAFADSALQWIYIPATVTVFADSAFDGCTAALIICAPENSPAAMYAEENGISLELE